MPRNQKTSPRRLVRDGVPPKRAQSGYVHPGKQLEQDAGRKTCLSRAHQPRRGVGSILQKGGPTRPRRAFVGRLPARL